MSPHTFARQALVLCAALVALVAPAAAVTVTVSPRVVTLSPTGSQQFSATVEGASTTAAVVWAVEESGGGTMSSSGLYTPPSGFGTYHLRATSVEDSAAFDVATIDVASIGVTIAPVSASLAAGASQLFEASVSAPSGVSHDVIWSLQGSGSENSGGRPTKVTVFTAPDVAGLSQLIATSVADPSVRATATISTRDLVITPQAVTISPTGTVQFSASGDQTRDPVVVWSVEEADGGTISNSGLYTPPPHTGLFHVRATSARSSTNYDVASVDVEPLAVTVSPPSADLAVGSSQLFSAAVTAPSGVNTDVVWSLSGGGQQSSGTTPSKLTVFTAPATAGTSTLAATSVVDPSVRATVTINVRSVIVSPKTATVTPTGSLQFTASDGGGPAPVAWTVEEAGGGSISGSGLYTPPAAFGTYHVRAARLDDPSNYDRAMVTVQAIGVTISPVSALVLTDGSQLFSATVSAPAGASRNVTWSLSGVGTLSTSGPSKQTSYTAPPTPGSATLVATSVADPSVQSQATITVSEAAVAVSPSAAALLPGGNQNFNATVTGAANSGVTWRIVEGSAVGGRLSSVTATSVVYTAPTTFGTYHLEATSTADPRKKAVAAVDVGRINSVTVSPALASLPPLGSQVFSATVDGTGSFTNAVRWTATGGTIDPATGAYTAPATGGTFQIRATSLQDSSVFGEAIADVHAVTNITVAPSSATLNTAESRNFTATVSGTGNFDASVTWSATAGTISGTGSTITYTAPGHSGSATLTAKSVEDPTHLGVVAITIANRPPVLTVPGPQTVNEGIALTFRVSATDPDQDALTVAASGLPSGATFDAATRAFSWTPGFAQAGSYTVTFVVTDNGTPNLSDTRTVTINVANVNRAPVLTVPGPQTVNEGVNLSFTVSATDADGDALSYVASGLPSGAAFDASTRAFSWTPSFAQAGSYTVTFIATDNGTPNLSDTKTVTINVANVNRAPVLTVPGPQTVNEGVNLSFTVSATDADGDALSYAASGLPSGAAFDASTRAFSWTPSFAQAGSYTVTFIATDNGTLNLSDTKTVTINVANVNRAPVLTVPGPQTVNEGVNLSFTVSATDADGDALSYAASGLPSGATFDASTRAFSWTPNFTQSGSYTVTFTATDNGTPNLSDTRTVTINVANVNRAPVLTVPGPQTVNEGVNLSFTVSATDPDGDALSYVASGLPSGATFDAATRAFSWTPSFAQAGSYTVTFTATDNGSPNLSDTKTVTINVANVNRAPVLTVPGSQTVNEGVNLSFTVSATDPDGDALSYAASGLPSGATFDASARTFSWTPGFAQAGFYTVTFVVTDNGTPNLSDTRTVTINVANVNHAPVLTVPGPQTVNEGINLSFTVSATDSDGDALSFAASVLPSGATFDAAARTFSWTPGFAQAGSYTVTFTATDNGTPNLSDSKTVAITVAAPVSSGNPFVYETVGDQAQACFGMSARTASSCDAIGDLNDRLMCRGLALHDQSPCTQMTDRNLQLTCYGIAIAPLFPSNCRDITDVELQKFCYAVSAQDFTQCSPLSDRNTQLLCFAMSNGIASNCRDISDPDLKEFCYGVASHNTSYCSIIGTGTGGQCDPFAESNCATSGDSWNPISCTCTPRQVPTSTSLTSSSNPATFGQPVTLTATVTSGSGTPTGTVAFMDGATTLGTASLSASGMATWTTSNLNVGDHSLTAVYGGDGAFTGSTSATLVQTINEPAPVSAGNPFVYASVADQAQACFGMSARTASSCDSIGDLNDQLMCRGLALHDQSPCTQMTDRNLQLTCYGMAIAPLFPSNCRDITDLELQKFCFATSAQDATQCFPLNDRNTELLCFAMSNGIASNCRDISDPNLKEFCYGVSSHNTSYCSIIGTGAGSQCDPFAESSCATNGDSWDPRSCTCSSATNSLSVGLVGTGSGTVTSSPAGISCGSACSASFPSGSVVTLTAAAASGSTFMGWSGGGCSGTGSCTVNLSTSQSVSATFEVSAGGGDCGEASCVPVQGMYVSHFSGPGCTGTESYYLPYDGYAYTCRTWDGGGQCGTIHRTVTNYSARINGGPCEDLWPQGNTLSDFVTVYRGGSSTSSLSVGLAGTGSGTVTSSPAGISCGSICSASFPSGSVVTLTAAAASGATFVGWSGGGCSGTGSCTVNLSTSQSVSATFDVSAGGDGCGEASCVPVQGMYVSHFSGPGCTGTESYYLPYDGFGYSCRTWDGDGQCGTIHRTVTNYSARINGGPCEDLWPQGNTLSDFVTVYRGSRSQDF